MSVDIDIENSPIDVDNVYDYEDLSDVIDDFFKNYKSSDRSEEEVVKSDRLKMIDLPIKKTFYESELGLNLKTIYYEYADGYVEVVYKVLHERPSNLGTIAGRIMKLGDKVGEAFFKLNEFKVIACSEDWYVLLREKYV